MPKRNYPHPGEFPACTGCGCDTAGFECRCFCYHDDGTPGCTPETCAIVSTAKKQKTESGSTPAGSGDNTSATDTATDSGSSIIAGDDAHIDGRTATEKEAEDSAQTGATEAEGAAKTESTTEAEDVAKTGATESTTEAEGAEAEGAAKTESTTQAEDATKTENTTTEATNNQPSTNETTAEGAA